MSTFTYKLEDFKEAAPVKMEYTPIEKSSSPCTHVLHLSDWHYGAVTKRDDVDGFGEYSSKIAEQRILALGQAIIKKTIVQRHGYVVPRLHILGTADYISGDIHLQKFQNLLHPTLVWRREPSTPCGCVSGS